MLFCLSKLSLQGHANRYKRHIVPVLSLSVDFYVRVFVRIYTSPAAVKDSGSKLMYMYQSQGCDSFFTQRVGRKVRPVHGHLCFYTTLHHRVAIMLKQCYAHRTNIAVCTCSHAAIMHFSIKHFSIMHFSIKHFSPLFWDDAVCMAVKCISIWWGSSVDI